MLASGAVTRVSDSPEHRLRVVCSTTLDALLVVDDQRRYVEVNHAAAELLGSPREKVLTRRIDHFTPVELLPTLERLWSEFRKEGRQHGRYQVLRGDGSKVVAQYRAAWNFGPREHLIAARAVEVGRVDGGRWAEIAEPRLTRREREVLQLAAAGQTAPAIAKTLVVSIGTARTHLRNAYKKLDAHDRAAAVAKALRLGLID
jgi:PAS domain S-box-containing protein